MMVTLSAASLLALMQAVAAWLLTGLLFLSDQKSARWLAGFSFFFGISFFLGVVGSFVSSPSARLTVGWLSWVSLFAVPCLYVYTSRAIQRSPSRWGFHFLLAPLAGGSMAALMLDDRIAMAFGLLRWLVVLQLVVYGIFILYRTRQYRRELRMTRSSLAGLDLAWLDRLVLLLMILVGFDVSLFPFLGWLGVPHADIQLYFNALASLYLLWLAKGAAQQHFVVLSTGQQSDKPAPVGSLDKASIDTLAKDLEAQLMKDLLYRNPTLTLEDLARAVNLSRHTVSEVINRGHGKNFYDFINDFRVDCAKGLLASTDKTILEAAFEAGFNNKASFNRAFKTRVGTTPSQFRKTQRAAKA